MVPGSVRPRVVVASLVGLAAADGAVAQYFISAYSDPAGPLGILVLVP